MYAEIYSDEEWLIGLYENLATQSTPLINDGDDVNYVSIFIQIDLTLR